MQDLLTEVKIRNGKLLLSFQELGSAYFKWNHRFVTRPLSPENATIIQKELSHLGQTHPYYRAFPVIQIDANIESTKAKLQDIRREKFQNAFRNRFGAKEYKEYLSCLDGQETLFALNRKLKERPNKEVQEWIEQKIKPTSTIYAPYHLLCTDKQTTYAKGTIATPGTVMEINETLFTILNEAECFKKELHDFFRYIRQRFNDPKRTARNALQGQAKAYRLRNKTTAILDRKRELAQKLKVFDGEIIIDTEDEEAKITLPDTSLIKRVRAITPAEFFKLPTTLLDTEIPRYKQHPDEVSWIGLQTREENILTDSTIITIHEFKSKGEFKKRRAGNVEQLVDKCATRCRESAIISAYNLPFDAIHLREAGDFEIGLRDTEPVKEVSTKFFERIGIHGKMAIDLYRWAVVAFSYLPNQKLETIHKHLFGEELSDLTYGEMLKEEEKLYSDRDSEERTNAGKRIQKYLEHDVKALGRLWESKEFKQSIEDVCWMAEHFKTDMTRLLHNQNAINEAQEWEYFINVGTWRANVYLRTKHRTKKEQQAMQHFREWKTKRITAETTPGVYENVWQAYIPTSFFLKDMVKTRFPKASELNERINAATSAQQKYFLSKYEDALCRWVLNDYIYFLEAHELLIQQSEENRINTIDIQRIFLEAQQNPELRKKAIAGKLAQKDIAAIQQTRFPQTPLNKLTEAVNTCATMARLSNQISGQYLWSGHAIYAAMEAKFYTLHKWLEKTRIIHAQGDYIYLQHADFEQAPVIPVYKHDKVIITHEKIRGKEEQKIYYEAAGALHGIPEKEEPYPYTNLIEMRTYASMIRNILNKDIEEALQEAQSMIDTISCRKIKKEELVFYSGASNTYSGYDIRYEDKIEFILPEHVETDGEDYVLNGEKSKTDPNGNKYFPSTQVFIMKLDDFKPNYQSYARRTLNRTEAILKSVLKNPRKQLEEYLNTE